jgi:large-conductance mechanosensitive channel
VVFFIVRAVNKFKNAAPEEAPAISSTDALLTEIRDALKAK